MASPPPSATPDHVNVVVEGTVLPGNDPVAVKARLAELIRRDVDFAGRLLGGRPKTIKSGVALATGDRYVAALKRIGVAAHTEAATLDIDAGTEVPARAIPESGTVGKAPFLSASTNSSAGVSLPISDEEVYRAAIGPRNLAYYLAYFAQANAAGKTVLSWNWPAFLVPVSWALYRKMYKWFFALLVVSVSVGLLEKMGAEVTAVVLYLGATVIFAAYANSLYRRHITSMIAGMYSSIADKSRLVEFLTPRGGVHRWVPWVCGSIPIIGILLAIAIPAYVDKRGVGPQATAPRATSPPSAPRQGADRSDKPNRTATSPVPLTAPADALADPRDLYGRWRCVGQEVAYVGYWHYRSNGQLWFYGPNATGEPFADENTPTSWKIEGSALIWEFGRKGPDWVAENAIMELRGDRLRYRDSLGELTHCVRG